MGILHPKRVKMKIASRRQKSNSEHLKKTSMEAHRTVQLCTTPSNSGKSPTPHNSVRSSTPTAQHLPRLLLPPELL